MALSKDQLAQFHEDGYLVVKGFITSDEAKVLKSRATELVKEETFSDHISFFDTSDSQQANDDYFLNSSDKIRFFFENHAYDKETKTIKGKPEECMNKIGHALHVLEPAFKKVAFSDKLKSIATQIGLENPYAIQGMYIFKNARVGGEVTPHQDCTFLRNNPINIYGCWLALDNATLENGCLWFVPGSHRWPMTRKFKRMNRSDQLLALCGPAINVPDEAWVPVPVNAGDLILIHGKVYHKSEENKSDASRHAFTLHLADSKSTYSKENWLQPGESGVFPVLETSA